MNRPAVTGSSGTLGRLIQGRHVSVPKSLLVNKEKLIEFFEAYNVKILLHLASPTQTFDNEKANQDFKRGIYDLSLNTLEAFAIAGGQKFGYVSTSHVYGFRENTNKLTEEDSCVPISEYAKWKFETENAISERARVLGTQIVILRPFSVFGKGMRSHFLAGRLTHEEKSQNFTTINYAQDLRDFSTPIQTIEKIMRVMELPWTKPSAIFNICSGVPLTVKERVLIDFPNFPTEKFIMENSNMPFLVGNEKSLKDFFKENLSR